MYNVNFEIASSVFLIILFAYLKLQYSVKSEINRVFQHLVIWVFITGVLDVTTALLINHSVSISNSLNTWLNTLYLAVDAIMAYEFVRYFSFVVHKKPNATFLAKDGWFLIVLHCAILLANVFAGFVFYFNDAHEYCRGPAYVLVYAIPQILVFSGVIMMFVHYRRFSWSQRVSIIIFTLVGFSGSFLQLIINDSECSYLLALFTTSIALFMIMFAMETPDFFRLMKTMEKLKATADHLDRANKAKSDFLSNMSHELRTPINSILGYNELIIKDTVEKHIAECALNVQAGARALLSQVNNVFDYTDIDRGRFRLYLNKYYTNSFLQDVALYAKFNAERKSLDFKINVAEKLPSRMNGDVVRIMQVMTNLLSNAFKFTKRGCVTLDVKWLPMGSTKGKIQVTISDTGCGIKEDLLPQLGSEAQLLGLGLPLVTKLLSMMGSSLDIKSEVGKGSVFSFELEQEVVESSPIGKVDFIGREAILNNIDENAFIAPKAKILVVDDNEMNIKLFCGLLKDTKISFDSAHNGVEALDLLKVNTYDLIFLDHMMPEKDGIQVLHEMKDNKWNVGVPVIVLTANSVVGAREMYLSEGFDDYMSKPVNLTELRTCVREHLSSELVVETAKNKVLKKLGDLIDLLPEQIDVKLGMSYCEDDKDFYIDVLSHYVENRRDDLIDEAYTAKDLEQYQSLLHVLKDSSLSIGAVQLSVMAKSLESAAKKSDWKFIDENHGHLLMDYQLILRDLEKIVKKSEKNNEKVSETGKPVVLMVDDEAVNLHIAEKLLSDYFVLKTAISGEAALALMEIQTPDVVLLDINMDGISGLDVFEKMQGDERLKKIPVVFLTADENVQTEVACFNAGAMDFIKKPLVKEVVVRRITRILQLTDLQKNLQKEVDARTHELLREQQNSEQLSSQIMTTLAAAIDAKDKYTNGHSIRVAKYSQMLCKALGRSEEDQKIVYSMGLLHDIGKIGIPDEIINKTSRLSDEEFDVIKTHPVVGSDILKSISTFPELAEGARSHHERYDGHGYPDGLKGDRIPDLVKILCVADAYDAMASTRSYRSLLPQSVIREEIEKCSGSQFDPLVAEKMLAIIDADKEYLLHE